MSPRKSSDTKGLHIEHVKEIMYLIESAYNASGMPEPFPKYLVKEDEEGKVIVDVADKEAMDRRKYIQASEEIRDGFHQYQINYKVFKYDYDYADEDVALPEIQFILPKTRRD